MSYSATTKLVAGMFFGASITAFIAALEWGARDMSGYWISACMILGFAGATTLGLETENKRNPPRRYRKPTP